MAEREVAFLDGEDVREVGTELQAELELQLLARGVLEDQVVAQRVPTKRDCMIVTASCRSPPASGFRM